MGCDYYITTYLVIEYNNNEKKHILLSKLPRWFYFTPNHDKPLYYYEREEIEKETETKILYENGNWINNHYGNNYDYYLEDKTNVKTVKKVVSGYSRS
jgi:hypothetical protein